MNEEKKMQIIQELMDLLKEEMQPGKEDFAKRLGREEMPMEGDMPEQEMMEEKIGVDIDGDDEMGESPEHAEMVMGEDEDEDLKSRLMKMRG